MGRSNTTVPTFISVGSVVLRGVTEALDTDSGREFVTDCARQTEGLLSESDMRSKWALGEEAWAGLAANSQLLDAVRAERNRRVRNGEATREAAQQHFAKAPTVLGDILTDEQVSPRHRIEAARELRQVVGDSLDATSGTGEKFVITINLGGDEKLIYEKEIAPYEPSLDDGELP